MSERTFLVVEHEVAAPAAWLGEELAEAGVRLDVCRPYAGEPLPDLSGYAGLLVLGGAMDAWDDRATPWLPATRALVVEAEATGVLTLAICLGHQLAAVALGGEVGRNPAGATLAVHPVGWTEAAAADPLLAGVRLTHAVHWNNDVVLRLPDGATVLARSSGGQVQAARLAAHVWGVQFHPEAGPELVTDWVAAHGSPYAAAGVDLDGYVAAVRARREELAAGCASLAAAFAALSPAVGRGAR